MMNQRISRVAVFTLFISIISIGLLFPQTVISIESSTPFQDSVDLFIKGENLSLVGAITIKLVIDTTILKWGKFSVENSSLTSSFAGRNGSIITIAWDDISGVSFTNSMMYRLRFGYLGGAISAIFDKNSSELADINGNVIPVLFRDLISTNIKNEKKTESTGKFYMFPNPVKDRLTIGFDNYEPEPGKIVLLNSEGEFISSIYEGIIGDGKNIVVEKDLKNMSSGIYFIQAVLNSRFVISKFLLIK